MQNIADEIAPLGEEPISDVQRFEGDHVYFRSVSPSRDEIKPYVKIFQETPPDKDRNGKKNF